MKSYYQCCYASPVTSNPIDAERHRWRLPATCSTVQFLQRGSLMGGPADKGQERWHCWHWWGTKWRTEKGGGSAGEDGGVGEKNVIIRVHEYCHSCLWTVPLRRTLKGEKQLTWLGQKSIFNHQELLWMGQCPQMYYIILTPVALYLLTLVSINYTNKTNLMSCVVKHWENTRRAVFICPASTLCRIILLTWPEFNRAGVCKKYKYLEVEPVLLITHHSLLAILDFHKQKEQASHAADLLCGGETVFIILYWLLAYEKTKDPTFPPPCGWSLLPSS